MSFENEKSIVTLVCISLMHRIAAFNGTTLQRGYDIGSILKDLTRKFAAVVKKALSRVEFKYWMTLVEEKM